VGILNGLNHFGDAGVDVENIKIDH